MVIAPHGIPIGSLLPHPPLTESRIAQNAAIEVAEKVRGGTGIKQLHVFLRLSKKLPIALKCWPALMLLQSLVFLTFTFHLQCVVVEEPIDTQ